MARKKGFKIISFQEKKPKGRKLKTFVSLLLGIPLLGSIGIWSAEAWRNASNREKIEASFAKMADEKFVQCKAEAAETREKTRRENLEEIGITSYRAIEPDIAAETFLNGAKRLTNAIPFLDVIDVMDWIPEAYKKGSYTTDLDEYAEDSTALARLGVGICYDKALAKHNLGSAYIPPSALLTINPRLTDEDAGQHVQKHVHALSNKLVTPLARASDFFVQFQDASNTAQSDLTLPQIKEGLGEMLDEWKNGDSTTLPLEGDAEDSAFGTLSQRKYKAPLVK